MNFTFSSYGAAECVAGSKHILTVNDYNLLIDIGFEHTRNRRSPPLEFDPTSLDSLVLTHGHADHVGRLHELIYQGFDKQIYCHPATKDICRIQLEENLVVSLFRKNKAKKHHLDSAKTEIEKILDKIIALPYGHELVLSPSLTRKTLDAGHLIGSEQNIFTIDNKITIGFSGDLGRTDADIPFTKIPEPLPKHLDFFVLEGTYGTKRHTKTRALTEELEDYIKQAYKHGGKAVFPTFSIQRAQHLLVYLFELYNQHKLPQNMKIVLDSPSAEKVNQIVLKHLDCLDTRVQNMFADPYNNPFCFPLLEHTHDRQDSFALRSRKSPTIIVTSAGMCNGGRIENYLGDILENKRNVLVLTGYQANGTRGSYLANGAKEVFIRGKRAIVNAAIGRIHGFSGHSDCDESILHLKQSNDPAKGEDFKGLFLVHGEKQNLYDLKNELNHAGYKKVIVVEHGKTYDLDEIYRRFYKTP